VFDVVVGVLGDVGVVGFVGLVGVVGVVGVCVVPFSMAVATISISPFSGTVFAVGNSVMTVPPGAVNGTLSHAEEAAMALTARAATATERVRREGRIRASITNAKDNTLMGLAGQADRRGERGYAMAALLVMMAIMAILMTVAMPVWRHEAQREKEEETIFRGTQYARAIAAYRNKTGTFPTNIDALVEGRYLRKKFKDPLTKAGEWQLIPAGVTSVTPGIQNPQGGVPPQGTPQPQWAPMGGIGGVASKSQETSIRTYRGATRYNLWQFTWQIASNAQRGGGPGGRGGPGGLGGPGGQGRPGGPNQPPGAGRGPTNNPGTNPFGSGGQGTPRGFGQPGSNQPPTGGRGPGRGGRGF
jgi:type II secretory pathway pseudopilin PulG